MRRTLIALVATLSLASCGDGEGAGTPFIRATFDGQVWNAEAQQGIIVYTIDIPEDGTVWTVASRRVGGGSQFITLNLPIPASLGTHPLDGSTASASYSSCPNEVLADCISWKVVPGHPGTLVIDRVDSADGLIEGAFVFDGYALGNPEGESKSFTAGRFRIYAPSLFILD